MSREITVGEAARRAGVSRKAVRLYEARGLLPPAARTPSGYRTYTDHDVRLLRFIRGARRLGLSLNEIRAIVEMRRNGGRPSQEVVAALERHLAEIDRSIVDLLSFKENLSQVVGEARSAADGPEGLCAVIAGDLPPR